MSQLEVFNKLPDCHSERVSGVVRFHAGAPSTRVAVVVGSHGKEVKTGIPIIEKLCDSDWRRANLSESHDITVILGNRNAARLAMMAEGDELKKYRFTPGGTDNNRHPADPVQLSKQTSYESLRALDLRRALLPIEFSHVLDVHSTDQPSQAAALGILGGEHVLNAMFSHMAVTQVISNVGPIQASQGTRTKPFSSLLEPTTSAIEVECGQTGDPVAAQNALDLFLQWGRCVGHVAGEPTPYNGEQKRFRVVASVMAPDTTYRVADKRFLEEFAPVTRGELLLQQDTAGDLHKTSGMVLSPCDGLLIWSPSELELSTSDVASEIWFVVKPA